MSWEGLIEEARKAFKERDIESLRGLDDAFHHFFLNELRRGNEESRTEFIMGILEVVESPESREIGRADEVQELIVRWRHLDALMNVLRTDGDLIDQAERLIMSRELGERLLRTVEQAEFPGVKSGELARRLNISPPHMTKLLREMETCDVLERRPFGRNVYVTLGLVGQLLLERRRSARKTGDVARPKVDLTRDSPIMSFLPGGRELFIPLN
jgi:DNA-binding MarR family transcriptional regulator